MREHKKTPTRTKLGQRVRQARKVQQLSQEGLAELCGLHYTYIGALERGECNVTFDNLSRITRGLNLDVGDVVTGIEEMDDLDTQMEAKACIAGLSRGRTPEELRFGLAILKSFLNRRP